MKARVMAIRDVRHEDADKLPTVTFWVAGNEIAEAVKATATYVGGAASLLIGKKHYEVYLNQVVFGEDKEATFKVAVEDGQKIPFSLGDEVEIAFSKGGNYA